MSSSELYRDLENRFRGERNFIKSRLEFYLPFVMPLLELYPKELNAVDLGCGRGEWVELMCENGFSPIGVDIDEHMLAECVSRDLPTIQQDALSYITSLPQNSHCVVSAFHFVEHVTFEVLQRILEEAFRVLKPAGILILETPNSENIVVATNNFYVDPTHAKPIPHQLLSFVVEHQGFSRTKVARLQEAVGIKQKANMELYDVLNGVSPDYGVIGQKPANEEDEKLFGDCFEQQYGVDLALLANLYDNKWSAQLCELQQRVEGMESIANNAPEVFENYKLAQAEIRQLAVSLAEESARAKFAETQLEEQERRLTSAETLLAKSRAQEVATAVEISSLQEHVRTLDQVSAELHAALQQNHHHWQLIETQGKELEELSAELHAALQQNHHHWQLSETQGKELEELYASLSWKFTKPLRWLTSPFMSKSGNSRSPRNTFFARLVRWGMAKPSLVNSVHFFTDLSPSLNNAIARRVADVMDRDDFGNFIENQQPEENILMSSRSMQDIQQSLNDRESDNVLIL